MERAESLIVIQNVAGAAAEKVVDAGSAVVPFVGYHAGYVMLAAVFVALPAIGIRTEISSRMKNLKQGKKDEIKDKQPKN